MLLVLLAIVPAKDHFREWLHYQNEYHTPDSQSRRRASRLARRFQGGVQQIWMPELGVVDRCTTCHVALKEASLAGVETQPFRPHPPIPHALTEFGCVMCHRGQGAATTVEEAHSSTLAWEQPILPARYVESSCGQCHERPLTGTPQLNAGRDMLARYGCVRCHRVASPGRPRDDRDRHSASAEPHRREDHARMDFRLDQKSPGLRRNGHHAELPVERRRCARYFRVPHRPEHALSRRTRPGRTRRFRRRTMRRRCNKDRACTANPSAPPATPCRTPPD